MAPRDDRARSVKAGVLGGMYGPNTVDGRNDASRMAKQTAAKGRFAGAAAKLHQMRPAAAVRAAKTIGGHRRAAHVHQRLRPLVLTKRWGVAIPDFLHPAMGAQVIQMPVRRSCLPQVMRQPGGKPARSERPAHVGIMPGPKPLGPQPSDHDLHVRC